MACLHHPTKLFSENRMQLPSISNLLGVNRNPTILGTWVFKGKNYMELHGWCEPCQWERERNDNNENIIIFVQLLKKDSEDDFQRAKK